LSEIGLSVVERRAQEARICVVEGCYCGTQFDVLMKNYSLQTILSIGFGLTVAIAPVSAMKFEIPKELQAAADAKAAKEEEVPAMSFGAVSSDPVRTEEVDASAYEVMTVDVVESPVEIPDGMGRIAGRIVDKESGIPIVGVAILLEGTDFGTITDGSGSYRIDDAPAGRYTISMIKGGYIEANVTDFEVVDGEVKQFAFALPPRPAEMSDEVYELQDFSVTAEEASVMMLSLDLRMNSDTMLDVMSAEDFSKFAAGDVAEAIKRLPGVTIQEGKFAVIRGLDERYTSTLFNGVPVPSPDPDRQSVPLDLFPSEVVKSLSVSKTYSPEYQGNAAAGTIDIMTNSYAEEFTVNLSSGLSWNEKAQDKFINGSRKRQSIDYGDLGSLENTETAIAAASGGRLTPEEESAPQEYDYSIDISDTQEFFGRQFRYLASASHETNYKTVTGTKHNQYANAGRVIPIPNNPIILTSGDLAEGKLSFSEGDFDTIESVSSKSDTYLVSFLADLDEEGMHQIGYTFFKVNINDSISNIQQNGSFEGVSETELRNQGGFYEGYVDLFNGNGGYDALLESGLYTSLITRIERELQTNQVLGNHDLSDLLPGVSLDWIYSHADTSQTENNSFVANAIQLPDGSYNTGQNTDMGDSLAASAAWQKVEEKQDYYQGEVGHELEINDELNLESTLGYSHEKTDRNVKQEFYTFSSGGFKELTSGNLMTTSNDDLNELIADAAGYPNISEVSPSTEAEGERKIEAFFLNGKLSVGDKIDIIGGVRYEDILMTSKTSSEGDFFNYELLRDTSTGGATPQRAIENTQILGLSGPLSPDYEGRIDEQHWLPAFTFIYRPIEPVRVVASYSQTVARPSFKEFTYVTTQDPSSLDYVSGNPTLETSDVESFDLRVEYVAENGDLYAIGGFWKTVDQPIEKTSLYGSVQTDLYFNNPNSVDIYGVEFEARKTLDFLNDDFLSLFSIGGNLALIEAEIDVPESFQELLSGGFYYVDDQGVERRLGGDFYANAETGEYEEAPSSRPLFNQPKWIGNVDITFEQPEWGTRATLALFTQSEVLVSAASYLAGVGNSVAVTDRYMDSYYQLDFTLKQRINDIWTFGFSVKNLTDTERTISYDDDVVSASSNETYKLGREYKISLSATF
jgi:outer membrane receptor protein involved in Fe transport